MKPGSTPRPIASTATRSSQTLTPVGSWRSCGSRVRFPVHVYLLTLIGCLLMWLAVRVAQPDTTPTGYDVKLLHAQRSAPCVHRSAEPAASIIEREAKRRHTRSQPESPRRTSPCPRSGDVLDWWLIVSGCLRA